MQKIIRNSILGVVLVAFILASVGVNVLVHYCNHSKKTDFQSFPELSLQKPGCACHAVSCGLTRTAQQEAILSKANCCKNNSLNLKVNHFELPSLAKLKPIQLFAGNVLFQHSTDYQTLSLKNLLKDVIPEQHAPPLLRLIRHQNYPPDQEPDPLS